MLINNTSYDVAVAGGGLAGLASSIQLAKKGFRVILFEKNYYPFHRVCGEYISEESRSFLSSLGVPFEQLDLPLIRKLMVSSPDGSIMNCGLEPGGFGVSRYRLDAILAGIAQSAGVIIQEGTKVNEIRYETGRMKLLINNQELTARLVIGSFGKRSNLDLKWKRPFVLDKPGKLNNYIAVKYHIKTDHPADTIALHNFSDGYCGISRIEDGLYCMCYLTTANNLGLSNNSIKMMENQVIRKNPHLDKIFSSAEFCWKDPLSISQVSFAAKSLVEDHVLMAGDAAGMITPLCGNGMSMALHASKILSRKAAEFLSGYMSRNELEKSYSNCWRTQFGNRLKAGRIIQGFFGDPLLSKFLVGMANGFPGFANFLIRQTHGQQF
jgi:flavin-dependent dehydrogenase